MAREPALYADARWDVRHIEAPAGVAGWLLLSTRRHVPSLAELDDDEAADLGLVVRHCHRVLRQITGAERVYVAVLAEVVPHVHVHLVPRGLDAPTGFALFATQRAAADGMLIIDDARRTRIEHALAAAFARQPLPSA